jgi:hypothetical protein
MEVAIRLARGIARHAAPEKQKSEQPLGYPLLCSMRM